MTRFTEVRRFLGVLQRHASTLHQQAERQRGELARLDGEISRIAQDIADMKQVLAGQQAGGSFSRRSLFQARGKQAVTLYEITCRQLESEELTRQRAEVEHDLARCRTEALRLERKQDTHREWLRRQEMTQSLLRDLQAEAEILERRSYDRKH